jgi:hypothetical protein
MNMGRHGGFYSSMNNQLYTSSDLFVNNSRRLNQVCKVLRDEYPSQLNEFSNLIFWGKFDDAFSYLKGFLNSVDDTPVFGYIYYHNVDRFGQDATQNALFRGLTHRSPPSQIVKANTKNQKQIEDFNRSVTNRRGVQQKYKYGYNTDGKRERSSLYSRIVFDKSGNAKTEKRLKSLKTGRFVRFKK